MKRGVKKKVKMIARIVDRESLLSSCMNKATVTTIMGVMIMVTNAAYEKYSPTVMRMFALRMFKRIDAEFPTIGSNSGPKIL